MPRHDYEFLTFDGHYTPAAGRFAWFDPDQGVRCVPLQNLPDGLTDWLQCFTVAIHVNTGKSD
jgi:hypothetical protein